MQRGDCLSRPMFVRYQPRRHRARRVSAEGRLGPLVEVPAHKQAVSPVGQCVQTGLVLQPGRGLCCFDCGVLVRRDGSGRDFGLGAHLLARVTVITVRMGQACNQLKLLCIHLYATTGSASQKVGNIASGKGVVQPDAVSSSQPGGCGCVSSLNSTDSVDSDADTSELL